MIQLVIDIPEEDYNNIEPFLNGETIKGGFNLFKALEIIKNGNPLPTVIEALEQEPCEDMGEVSDGYHTFNQLYHQRAILFACIVNQNKNKAWKSFKHSDGKYCFDSNGEWFIVGVDTPQGSYTYHYAKEYWDMFDCQELEYGKEWDGHTEEDVTRLLSLESSDWIPVSERLPEDNELVLFSTKTDRVFEGRFFSDNTNRQWYSFCDRTFAWNNVVLAWMPLPEPYKAESEE